MAGSVPRHSNIGEDDIVDIVVEVYTQNFPSSIFDYSLLLSCLLRY